jgi:hypothetical protein
MPENPVTPDTSADPEKESGTAAKREEPEGPAQDTAKPDAGTAGEPSGPTPPAGVAPAPKPSVPAPSGTAPAAQAAGAGPAAPKPAPPRPAGARPAPAPKKPAPSPEEIAAARAKAVALFEEKKRLGEEVTVTVQHKSITFTGRVVKIAAEDGFVVLEHVDGRRRGLYFILGGHAEAKDGQKVELPVDGVAR